MTARMFGLPTRPQIYVFILWSCARPQEDRILSDLAEHFRILDVVDVVWTPDETFARNLTRMYGDSLPPGSDKEQECGTGPFRAVIVQDVRPRVRLRLTGRGPKLQNPSVFDARQRYRTWTGGGYRVHASDSAAETARNLVLLFGKLPVEFQGSPPGPGGVSHHAADPVGTHGWTSVNELRSALEAYGAHPTGGWRTGDDEVTASADDLWWAERIAGGRDIGSGVRELQVAGKPMRLTLIQAPRGPGIRSSEAMTFLFQRALSLQRLLVHTTRRIVRDRTLLRRPRS